jgi:hypothetical protein
MNPEQQMEQVTKTLEQAAKIQWLYFNMLIKEGFDANQAIMIITTPSNKQ